MILTFTKLGQYGRLGNQMFQYATLLGVAHNKFNVKIPMGCYDLKKFNITASTLTNLDIKSIKNNFFEKFYHFDKSIFDVSDWTNIFGYFQSYRYFNKVRDKMLSEFSLNKDINLKINKKLNIIRNNKKLVGVHVRRTDYLRYPQIHPFPGIEYYKKAINFFNKMFDCKFLIFSDDIKWCKEKFVDNNFIFSDFVDNATDLIFMSKCDHQIIANSSFSWWAAWLNTNSKKKVIFPKKWMGDQGPQDYYDLMPKEWMLL